MVLHEKILVAILIITFVIGCQHHPKSGWNTLKKIEKVILKEDGQEQFFYWEMDNETRLQEFTLGEVKDLNEYRDSLKLILGSSIYEETIEKKSSQSLSKALLKEEQNGDRINALLVQTDSVGIIRPINFLEAQILNYQLSRFPLLGHPTEFHGFIARNEAENKLRIYFASSDQPWPPKAHIILDELDKEIEKGWRLIAHLHNHYSEAKDNFLGTLAPSLADAHYYKMLKEEFNVEKALITNGFHTVEIKSEEFVKFESH